MSKVIKLRKGLDINLLGKAEEKLVKLPLASTYAVTPDDFEGVVPKLLVKEGSSVKAGTPLFFDKSRPRILFTSPVSGVVTAINRGDKRRIENLVIECGQQQEYQTFDVESTDKMDSAKITELLLGSGLWNFIIQRPYGIIANPEDRPKAVFISGFDSAPLAADMNFVLADRLNDLNKGVEILRKLTGAKVHLGLCAGRKGVVDNISGVERHLFSGSHPAGNVGVQIHNIDPVNKGETVWTINVQSLAVIGRFFNTGKVDMTRVIALTGPELSQTHYISAMPGTPISLVVRKINFRTKNEWEQVRIINGNVLTGKKVSPEGGVGFYADQITVIAEGNDYEFVGWALPRFNKLSVSRAYFSWLMPTKQYALDSNLNGGVRPFVMSGLYDRYLPMDIYPVYLLKAILAGDIDKMENLGIYEVVEEDIALCEFVDPSKIEMQQIIRDGINLMIKELN